MRCGPEILKEFDEPMEVYAVEAAAPPNPVSLRGPRPVHELVGREAAIAAVRAAWEAGSGPIVVVVGEPGIAKPADR